MNTIFQPPASGHEVCPQCQYPHFAAGHQRCISCGWVRGSEIAPRVGRQEFDVRANALASLLPGDPGVSIEQRIQAQQAVPEPPPPPPEPLPVAARFTDDNDREQYEAAQKPEPEKHGISKIKWRKPEFLQ